MTPRFTNLVRLFPRLVLYTESMPTAPDPAETDALRQFLAERDVACPGCGYNLRGSAGKQCPECGIALPNDFGAKSPRVQSGWHIAGTVGLILGLCANVGLFALCGLLFYPFAGETAGGEVYAKWLAVGVGIDSALLFLWFRARGRIVRWPEGLRAAIVLLLWPLSVCTIVGVLWAEGAL